MFQITMCCKSSFVCYFFLQLLMIVGICFRSSQLISFIRLLQACCVYFGPDVAIPLHCVEFSLPKLFLLYSRGQCDIRKGSGLLFYRTLLIPLLIYTDVLVGFNSVDWEGLFCSASSALSSVTVTFFFFNQQNLLPKQLTNLVHHLSSVLQAQLYFSGSVFF